MPSSILVSALAVAVSTLTLLVLAIYANVHASDLSLPLSTLVRILAILLPVGTALALLLLTNAHAPSTALAGHGALRGPSLLRRSLPSQATALALLALLDAVLLALAGSDSRQQVLDCFLPARWLALYRARDERAIRAIQDAFDCCGLRNPRQLAWPFQDGQTPSDECMRRFGRTRSCEGAWMGEQRVVLRLMVAVAAVGLVLKAVMVFAVRGREARYPYRSTLEGRVADDDADDDDEEAASAGRFLDEPRGAAILRDGHEQAQHGLRGGDDAR